MTNRKLRRVPGYVFLSLAAVASVFPLYFMLVSATNTSQDVLGSRLLPGGNLIANFTNLVASQNLGSALWYSTLYAVATTVLSWRQSGNSA